MYISVYLSGLKTLTGVASERVSILDRLGFDLEVRV